MKQNSESTGNPNGCLPSLFLLVLCYSSVPLASDGLVQVQEICPSSPGLFWACRGSQRAVWNFRTAHLFHCISASCCPFVTFPLGCIDKCSPCEMLPSLHPDPALRTSSIISFLQRLVCNLLLLCSVVLIVWGVNTAISTFLSVPACLFKPLKTQQSWLDEGSSAAQEAESSLIFKDLYSYSCGIGTYNVEVTVQIPAQVVWPRFCNGCVYIMEWKTS